MQWKYFRPPLPKTKFKTPKTPPPSHSVMNKSAWQNAGKVANTCNIAVVDDNGNVIFYQGTAIKSPVQVALGV